MRGTLLTEVLIPEPGTDNAQEEQIHIAYEPLTPSVIDDEKAQSYIEALNFACSRPDIRNIAVTGPYGAGKSSVLLTWEKSEDNDYRVMTVSLADFEMQRASPEMLMWVRANLTVMVTIKNRPKLKRKQSSTASCNSCSTKRKKRLAVFPSGAHF
jgi:ABC-type transport system involved in cytochrome bd biosynthesis fused ATPase/permease subunit